MAFEPRTGALLWTCDGPNIGVYSGPFFGDGVVALNASGTTNTLLAVRPGGRGDVTETHRLWIQRPGNNKTCLGAGVIHNGHIYQVNMMGFAECRELQTGRTVWEERLTGTGARNASWSAPVLAGDRLYVPNKNADVFVLRASPRFECLATNSIGGEPMNASLAVSDGEIFIRTDKHLWCIGVVNIRSAFQAKRWNQNPVGRPQIDGFRGAIRGDFDHGVFLTTGRFTKDAEEAGRRFCFSTTVPIQEPNQERLYEEINQNSRSRMMKSNCIARRLASPSMTSLPNG
jgi:outer membrane protein assembly factor BamB